MPSTLLAVNVLDASSLLAAFGALGIAVVLFAETGLLVGFFLPGDSLLFTAGLLCVPGTTSGPRLHLWQVLPAALVGALVGAQVGYLIGARGGQALLRRSKNKSLHHGVERAEQLLADYGYGKAIVLARFIPVVRTVLNPMCGALEVPWRTFTLWQVVGGALWSIGVVMAGYALGSSVPNIDTYLLPIIGLVVVVSVIPIALELLRARKAARAADSADHGHDHGRGGDA
ncbi:MULTISPECIES: DedA family protein [unclassified Kitasatospora]|uniref:DedA family protein n=1 Tax=unclassified Kitasatospora TaxID=2633591 RepID=UPI00247344B5|nr:DedA family protein [Kitasatospora sp. MAP12-44]